MCKVERETIIAVNKKMMAGAIKPIPVQNVEDNQIVVNVSGLGRYIMPINKVNEIFMRAKKIAIANAGGKDIAKSAGNAIIKVDRNDIASVDGNLIAKAL